MQHQTPNIKSDAQEKREAIDFIATLGLVADEIPEKRKQKRPDLIVTGDFREYLVEIKAADDSNQWKADIANAKPASAQVPVGIGRKAFVLAEDALDQLKTYDPQHNRFWVLWLTTRRLSLRGPATISIMDSLFGVQYFYVSEGGTTTELPCLPCLNACESVFTKHKEIVGAVVAGDEWGLFVNDEAPDIDLFRQSKLYKGFEKRGPVNSISTLSSKAGFLLYDGDLALCPQPERVREFLIGKYGFTGIHDSQMQVYSASALVTNDR
ncbi:MAG: hypothetical protein HQL44_15320 [Alphaproteobacteria bacterium]|nr:hypothetical protein [Alphaproteobacteria bacterium]